MVRLVIAVLAINAGVATWVGLMYLLRYSGVSVLETLSVWISHLLITGWITCLGLVVLYYWAISALWRALNATGGL